MKIRKSEVRTNPCEILYFAIKVVPHVLEPLFTFLEIVPQKIYTTKQSTNQSTHNFEFFCSLFIIRESHLALQFEFPDSVNPHVTRIHSKLR